VDKIKDIGVWGTVFEGTAYPVAPVAPAKKVMLRLPPASAAPKALDPLASVAPIAARGGVVGALACN
jgi:hypothetical protein